MRTQETEHTAVRRHVLSVSGVCVRLVPTATVKATQMTQFSHAQHWHFFFALPRIIQIRIDEKMLFEK